MQRGPVDAPDKHYDLTTIFVDCLLAVARPRHQPLSRTCHYGRASLHSSYIDKGFLGMECSTDVMFVVRNSTEEFKFIFSAQEVPEESKAQEKTEIKGRMHGVVFIGRTQ